MATEAIIADQILDASTVGKDALKAANAGAFRTVIGAGTSSFDGAYSSLSGVPSTFTPAAHNQAWSTITSTPTTLSGYGITDALPLAGGTMTGAVTFVASTTGTPSINIPSGSAPSSPVSGDIWFSGSGLQHRVASQSFSVAYKNTNNSFTAAQSFVASTASVTSINIPHGTQKTSSLANGDVWSTTVGLFVQINTATQRVLIHAPTWNTYSPAGGATATLLLDATGSNLHRVTRPTSGNITIAFSGDTANQVFLLVLATSGSGTPGTVTWPAGLTWLTNAGVAPTISTAINKTDSVMFLRTGSGAYLAWHTGQN